MNTKKIFLVLVIFSGMHTYASEKKNLLSYMNNPRSSRQDLFAEEVFYQKDNSFPKTTTVYANLNTTTHFFNPQLFITGLTDKDFPSIQRILNTYQAKMLLVNNPEIIDLLKQKFPNLDLSSLNEQDDSDNESLSKKNTLLLTNSNAQKQQDKTFDYYLLLPKEGYRENTTLLDNNTREDDQETCTCNCTIL